MKFCKKCGKELENDAAVCTECGCATASVSKDTYTPRFSSENSIIATVLGSLGIVLPFVGIFLGTLVNMLLSGVCVVLSIIGLIFSIKALKEREPKSDTLAVIALFLAIVAIVISASLTLVYTIINIIAFLLLAFYIFIILAVLIIPALGTFIIALFGI